MRTRFAPSPTGPLHLGHAYSALLAADLATRLGGQFLLRIEDIDQTRARPHWENRIYDDLTWLGLHWPQPVMRQSDRMPAYRTALDRLWSRGLIYACHCSRRDIREALAAPQEGMAALGPDGPVYPGTCRPATPGSGTKAPRDVALRLNMARAMNLIGEDIQFTEIGPEGTDHAIRRQSATQMCQTVGDVVLARRDMDTSYHLSVVLDDAEQGITHVVRGADLADATFIHVVLQRLLDLPSPIYLHHRLIRDPAGKRLAKRDDARAIALYRDEGKTPADIRRMVNLRPSGS
ncbi:MAG: tRNA glutamyl-Q(34) synthetase GluQRS [Qingshengfaniella sp.]